MNTSQPLLIPNFKISTKYKMKAARFFNLGRQISFFDLGFVLYKNLNINLNMVNSILALAGEGYGYSNKFANHVFWLFIKYTHNYYPRITCLM